MAARSTGLLVTGDADPVSVQNIGGRSPLLLLGDHAGVAIPANLGDLGLEPGELARHIACDIGIAALGTALAERLDAPFIAQRYSRLVIDCNRTPGAGDSIAEISDGTTVPGNLALDADARSARLDQILTPYHHRIAQELDRRGELGRPTILVALHSFTPAMGGKARPWRYGVLHRGDSAFSTAVLGALSERHGQAVGDNQPYAMDGTDYTIPFHADPRGLDYLEIEVRQDLISAQAGVDAVAMELGDILARLTQPQITP